MRRSADDSCILNLTIHPKIEHGHNATELVLPPEPEKDPTFDINWEPIILVCR